MKKGIPPLVIGNWKMNPQSFVASVTLATAVKKLLQKNTITEVVLAPPALYLSSVAKIQNGTNTFLLGAQNAHYEKLGAFTGEISLPMLQQIGVSYVILGHSERRALGETDELINKKVLAALKAHIVPVVCIGERSRDHGAQYLSFVEGQVRKAFAQVSRAKLGQIVVAYEPIWAIGTGLNATPADVHEMKLFIEKVLSDIYGRNYAQRVRILYGGSVIPKNAEELFLEGTVDGFLVGGASLHAEDFVQIIKATKHI
jgi:triosephosphate isomerase (TIM)